MQANKIKLLPEHIIDQIKAGEVVERPSSLLKELIENSIDAKAEHIFIDIKNGGLDLIAIEDDGLGISYEDLPWAFCRHATSKISHFEDLYSLHWPALLVFLRLLAKPFRKIKLYQEEF